MSLEEQVTRRGNSSPRYTTLRVEYFQVIRDNSAILISALSLKSIYTPIKKPLSERLFFLQREGDTPSRFCRLILP